MRWTRTLIPTLREDPSDAEIISHKLMLRAGFIRKLAGGTYTYLPLGLRSLLKAIAIVREEMNRAGAVEIQMPILQPTELWEESGRLTAFGDLMCKMKDRTGRVNVLGPTHEEVVTHVVRGEVNSYKQLPITLYQIQTKFRDEIRPRFGVIRSREFLMKDAYSFDTGVEGLNRSYQAQYDAYGRIFDRAGLLYTIVEADTGLMGGDMSHEFMVPSPNGEDRLVHCPSCRYAANVETAKGTAVRADGSERKPTEAAALAKVSTPNVRTIDQVSAFLKVRPDELLKTLIYLVDGKPTALLLRGDHEVNDTKLVRAFGGARVEMAGPEAVRAATGAPVGFAGPVGLKIPVVADEATKGWANWATGANEADAHFTGVNEGRDYAPGRYADLRLVAAGDACGKCGKPGLALSQGIEVGHVFKLGTKYSEKMKALHLDEHGKQQPAVMGCYGIGVNRILAAAIETSYDANGIVWPMAIAPYPVLLVSLNMKDDKVRAESERLHGALEAAGVEVLWDDRDLAPGAKFKDADLIGIPVRATVGGKGLAAGIVEVKHRNRKEFESVPLPDAVEGVKRAIAAYDHRRGGVAPPPAPAPTKV